jgi:hypothetical protein
VASALGYVPLPTELATNVSNQLDALLVPASAAGGAAAPMRTP